MGAPVGHGAAGIIQPIAEPEMAAFRNIVVESRLALPEVPVQLAGHLLRPERSVVGTGGEERGDLGELAEPIVPHQLAGQAETRVAALLAAGLENSFRGLHGGHQPLAFVDSEGERLLAVDILAGFEGGEINQSVPVVRGGIEDRVNIFLLEQLAKILIDFGAAQVMRGFVGMFAIDIADGHRVSKTGGQFGDALSFAAAANESEIRPVIGRMFFRRLGLCQGLFHEPSRQSGAQTEYGRGFQKGPARKQDRSHFHDSLQVCLYFSAGSAIRA